MIVEERKHKVSGSAALAPRKKVVPRKRIKTPKKKRKTSTKNDVLKGIKAGGAILITGCVAFSIVFRYSTIYSNQKEIIAIRDEIGKVKEKNEELKVNLLKLNNISYVEEIATKDLKMIEPNGDSVAYYELEKNDKKENTTEEKGKISVLLDKIKNVLFN